jgi:predicted TIM-barrel fold metal-dependent hydrolase
MLTIIGVVSASGAARAQPSVDHHQHLFSPAATALSPGLEPIDARNLVELLDAGGIQRAAVLSLAFQFGNPNRPGFDDEYERVKAENDWTSAQVALLRDRLRGFCSFNPLADYALVELERCAEDPQLNLGLKLHFGNSDVDLDDPRHVDRLKEVFGAANGHDMAIVVHLRPSLTRGRPYGDRQARVFLNDVLPAALGVTVQIAHLGSPPGVCRSGR